MCYFLIVTFIKFQLKNSDWSDYMNKGSAVNFLKIISQFKLRGKRKRKENYLL